MAIIVARGIRKRFGQGDGAAEALRGVDMEVEPGEFVAIMGPSGSGKSTLLYLLGGVDTPSEGQVLVEGQDLAGLDDDQLTCLRRRRLGFIFQAFNLLPPLSVQDNVALPLVLDGVSRKEARHRAAEMLESVGMLPRSTHLPGTLSGGEQQRVAIARALAIKPALLLADEPTGNLDTVNGQHVTTLLRRLVAERHVAIAMVTHDPDVARQTDRIVQIRDGKIEGVVAASALPTTRPEVTS